MLETVESVLGLAVKVIITDVEGELTPGEGMLGGLATMSGELARGYAAPDGRFVTFRVGQVGSFTLFRDEIASAKRQAIDTGTYWEITVQQRGIQISIADGYN